MFVIGMNMLCMTAFMICFLTLNFCLWEILKKWIECPCFLFSLYIRLLIFSLWYSFFLLCFFSSPVSPFSVFFFIFAWQLLSSFVYKFAFVLVFQIYSCSFLFVFFILLLVMRILVLFLSFFVHVIVQIGSYSKPSVLTQ
jgi:hypothetical protein